jgi:hypothetical protein
VVYIRRQNQAAPRASNTRLAERSEGVRWRKHTDPISLWIAVLC